MIRDKFEGRKFLILFLGPKCSGKTTQGRNLSKLLSKKFVHVSVGEFSRRQVRNTKKINPVTGKSILEIKKNFENSEYAKMVLKLHDISPKNEPADYDAPRIYHEVIWQEIQREMLSKIRSKRIRDSEILGLSVDGFPRTITQVEILMNSNIFGNNKVKYVVLPIYLMKKQQDEEEELQSINVLLERLRKRKREKWRGDEKERESVKKSIQRQEIVRKHLDGEILRARGVSKDQDSDEEVLFLEGSVVDACSSSRSENDVFEEIKRVIMQSTDNQRTLGSSFL